MCGIIIFVTLLLLFALAADIEWIAYGGDAGGTRFSQARNIDRTNVSQLKVAWTYKTKGLYKPKRGRTPALETTPLYVNGTLYATSAVGRVFALQPSTGKEIWSFDPKVDKDAGWGDFTNRGVSWHSSGTILAVSIDARMFALDAKTGRLKWQISLREGLRNPPQELSEYEQTSPPCVIGDIVVVGSAIADNSRTDMASGEVRGFDIKTGKLLWTWDPAPGTRTGGANAWSILTADVKRGVVFVPTGSASPDYYGGQRKAPNHANSVVALEAKTGRMVWSFQTVHHDLWDYDVASPPALVKVAGRDAVAAGSKTGHLFLLDRKTGKPIFGVEERPVPKSDSEGEQASPTQPFPIKPPSLAAHQADIRSECADLVQGLRNEGIFTPPSVQGSLVIPGNVGGLNWGGVAFDPNLNLIIAPANNLPALVRLVPRQQFDEVRRGNRFGFEITEQHGTPFGMARMLLIGKDGQPCQKGPHGALVAVDAKTGDIRWRTPLTVSLGGPITTAAGLVFMGATIDRLFRAFDTKTGEVLWSAELPAGARSTPMTYVHKGKQYVVVSAGGHTERFGPIGDDLIAFALPE